METPWTGYTNDEEGRHVLDAKDQIVCEHVISDEAMALILLAPELADALRDLVGECERLLDSFDIGREEGDEPIRTKDLIAARALLSELEAEK